MIYIGKTDRLECDNTAHNILAKLLATSGKLSESERMLTGNVGARKSSAVQIQVSLATLS